MNPDEDQEWIDALGTDPKRDFIEETFRSSPAMVKKESVNDHRMWRQYDPATFSEKEYDLVPDMWDHEHCCICLLNINPGDSFWRNSENHILCPACYENFKQRG